MAAKFIVIGCFIVYHNPCNQSGIDCNSLKCNRLISGFDFDKQSELKIYLYIKFNRGKTIRTLFCAFS